MENSKQPSGDGTTPDTKDETCAKCKTPLVGGIKYQGICTTCEPVYLTRCGSCYRTLWDCICVRPSTWE